MSWADAVVDDPAVTAAVTAAPRPMRPSYVPPHLRSKPLSASAPEFNPASKTLANTAAPPMLVNPNTNPNRDFTRPIRPQCGGVGRARDPNPYDIAVKFDQLAVAEQEEIIGGGGINFDAYDDIPVEASGMDVPAPVTSFAEIDLGDALNRNITMCKYVKPTPVQRHAIPISMAGRDLMACAQTGSGKTAAFCFPIICGIMRGGLPQQRGYRGSRTAFPLALILSPTRELASQIHEEAKKFSYQTGVKVMVAYGGAPMHQQLLELERDVDILVATPGPFG